MTAAKRKREEDDTKRDKINSGINKYFNSKVAAAAPKPKVSRRSFSNCLT
jgi:DNA polymerase alpha subunit A